MIVKATYLHLVEEDNIPGTDLRNVILRAKDTELYSIVVMLSRYVIQCHGGLVIWSEMSASCKVECAGPRWMA